MDTLRLQLLLFKLAHRQASMLFEESASSISSPATCRRSRYAPRVATFVLGHSSRAVWIKHERMAARATGSVQTAPGRITWRDPVADLRGVPVVGSGPGAIRGTVPGANLR
jgi:hypothetical protein